VVLIDSNINNVRAAKEQGLEAFTADVYSDSFSDNIEFNNIGFLIALTGNSQINEYTIESFGERFGENGTFRLVHSNEINNPNKNPASGLFSATDDYVNMMEVARHHGKIHEIKIKSQDHFEGLIEITKTDDNIIPLFIRKDHKIDIVPSMSLKMEIESGSILAYLGKEIIEKETGEVSVKENTA
jgi:Trk K+ transport system NAD-binding subunit